MGVSGAILLKFGSGHRRSGQKQKLLPHSLEPPVAQQGQVVTAVEHQGVLLGTRYVNPPDSGVNKLRMKGIQGEREVNRFVGQ